MAERLNKLQYTWIQRGNQMKFNEGTWENVQLNLKKKGTRCQGRDSGFAWRRRGGCGVRGSWGRACDVVAETTHPSVSGGRLSEVSFVPEASTQEPGRHRTGLRPTPGDGPAQPRPGGAARRPPPRGQARRQPGATEPGATERWGRFLSLPNSWGPL